MPHYPRKHTYCTQQMARCVTQRRLQETARSDSDGYGEQTHTLTLSEGGRKKKKFKTKQKIFTSTPTDGQIHTHTCIQTHTHTHTPTTSLLGSHFFFFFFLYFFLSRADRKGENGSCRHRLAVLERVGSERPDQRQDWRKEAVEQSLGPHEVCADTRTSNKRLVTARPD